VQDIRIRIEKLIADAAECDLIASLVAEKDKGVRPWQCRIAGWLMQFGKS
jgi:hypothetical protein